MAVATAERIERSLALFELDELVPTVAPSRTGAASAEEAGVARAARPWAAAVPDAGEADSAGAQAAVMPATAGASGAEVAGARGAGDDKRAGGGPTLDETIVGVWEGLAARSVVSCPCCGGAMTPHLRLGATADADVVTGRCDDCGATLE